MYYSQVQSLCIRSHEALLHTSFLIYFLQTSSDFKNGNTNSIPRISQPYLNEPLPLGGHGSIDVCGV